MKIKMTSAHMLLDTNDQWLRSRFTELQSLAISNNQFPCEYLVQLIQDWNGIEFKDDPWQQKHGNHCQPENQPWGKTWYFNSNLIQFETFKLKDKAFRKSDIETSSICLLIRSNPNRIQWMVSVGHSCRLSNRYPWTRNHWFLLSETIMQKIFTECREKPDTV